MADTPPARDLRCAHCASAIGAGAWFLQTERGPMHPRCADQAAGQPAAAAGQQGKGPLGT